MADKKYGNQFCFADSSIIISNYFINYDIIARYKVSFMSNTKTNTHTSIGIRFYVTHTFEKLVDHARDPGSWVKNVKLEMYFNYYRK